MRFRPGLTRLSRSAPTRSRTATSTRARHGRTSTSTPPTIAAHDKAIRRKWTQEATEDVIIHDEALEKALREQIARDIEQHYLGPDFDRNPATGADSPHAAEHKAFDDGLEVAARIARGKGDAPRPERCPTCGCDLAYPTAVHVVYCGEGAE